MLLVLLLMVLMLPLQLLVTLLVLVVVLLVPGQLVVIVHGRLVHQVAVRARLVRQQGPVWLGVT